MHPASSIQSSQFPVANTHADNEAKAIRIEDDSPVNHNPFIERNPVFQEPVTLWQAALLIVYFFVLPPLFLYCAFTLYFSVFMVFPMAIISIAMIGLDRLV